MKISKRAGPTSRWRADRRKSGATRCASSSVAPRPTPSSCSTSTSPSRSPKRTGLLRPVRPRAHLLGDGAMEGPVRRRGRRLEGRHLAPLSARASWDYSSAWGIRRKCSRTRRPSSPPQVVFFLRAAAGEFHSYYNAERVLSPRRPPRRDWPGWRCATLCARCCTTDFPCWRESAEKM